MDQLSEDAKVRVIVAETHALSREGLRRLLEQASTIKVVCQCGSAAEALQMARRTEADVVLMGAGIPEQGGVDTAEEIMGTMPEIKVAMLTTGDEEADMLSAFRAGVTGHLLLDTEVDDLVKSLELVAGGGVVVSPSLAGKLQMALVAAGDTALQVGDEVLLTEREREVLSCVARGMTNREIGETLFIAEHTVKVHIKNILEKLQLRNKQHAAAWAVVHGLV